MRDLLPNILWDSWTSKHCFINKKIYQRSIHVSQNIDKFEKYGDFCELHNYFRFRLESDKVLPFYFTRV
jgi:hypothetical protein